MEPYTTTVEAITVLDTIYQAFSRLVTTLIIIEDTMAITEGTMAITEVIMATKENATNDAVIG